MVSRRVRGPAHSLHTAQAMKQYQWNEHGVCLNPDERVVYCSKGAHLIIHTALHERGWCVGYKCHWAETWMIAGPSQGRYRNSYDTQAAAERSEMKKFLEMAGIPPAMKDAIRAAMQPEQMSMF